MLRHYCTCYIWRHYAIITSPGISADTSLDEVDNRFKPTLPTSPCLQVHGILQGLQSYIQTNIGKPLIKDVGDFINRYFTEFLSNAASDDPEDPVDDIDDIDVFVCSENITN